MQRTNGGEEVVESYYLIEFFSLESRSPCEEPLTPFYRILGLSVEVQVMLRLIRKQPMNLVQVVERSLSKSWQLRIFQHVTLWNIPFEDTNLVHSVYGVPFLDYHFCSE